MRTSFRYAVFGLLSLVLSPMAASGEEKVDPSVNEGSVLITTRDVPSDSPTDTTDTQPSSNDEAKSPAEAETLEPTSQSSEPSPELASENEKEASKFGAALAKTQSEQANAKAAGEADNAKTAAIPYQPVKFQGMIVGESTKEELTETWGEPSESVATDDGAVLIYSIEPFKSVEVLATESGVVSAIKVTLAAALDPKQLAKQLGLEEIDPVTVDDAEEVPLGQAFPERGVLFMFDEVDSIGPIDEDGLPPVSVSQVVIQPLDSRAFALRAENRLQGPYEKNVRDLETAISLDPDFAHAHWLLSEVYMATGQADSADAEAATACDIEPWNAAYQLRRGQTQALLGEYDEAVHRTRGVLDRKDLEEIVHAQALHEMAKLASLGDVQIATKAIPFHTRAIELADRVATDAERQDRRAAKRLMVEAHMSVAEEIARQAFNEKVESLSQWIGRASGLAEEYIENDGGSVELRLLIAQRALAALASFKPTLDPSPWVAEAEEAAGTLLAQYDDDLWQQRIKWELGIAYHNAMRVEHSRRQTIAAISYGQKAIEHLAAGAVSRQAVHSSEQLVGQLYFHMGAVHAVHQQDHTKAAQWYDKATPLLNGPRPVSELYAPRREGEMLVSIGVTYWQLGQQSRALEVTQSGASLIEMAVEDGILAKSALAVPYTNLATMYEQMGENTNAAKYTQLAKSVAPPAKKQPARVSRAIAGRRLPRVTIQAAGEEERPFYENARR
jgi:tetratricopeptide (TPR) repeat protein